MGNHHVIQSDVSLLNEQLEWVLEPCEVMQMCWNDVEKDWECLVVWKNQPEHEVTWESYALFR